MQQEKKYEWGDGVFTLLSWFKKEKVKNARVLVAGAGALGNEVVKDLALFGVGHIYVVDFDQIEISNLTRSVLFREEDAYNHAYKAEIVAKRAMEINPQINVVYLTAYQEYSFDAWSTGACGFMLKPLTAEGVRDQFSRLRYPIGGLG